MNISLEKVTEFLKPFLLKDIIIKTDKKVLKRGNDDVGILNYHLSSFIPNRQMNKVKCLDSSAKSKLYDNLVYILTSEDGNV